jgi:hypothetical protein
MTCVIATLALSGILGTGCSMSASTGSNKADSSTVTTPKVSQPKMEVVDGVPLIPISVTQRAACEKYADQLKRRVPCPGLLPEPIPVSPTSSAAWCLGEIGEDACGPGVIQTTGNVFLLSQSNFQVPRSYVGVTFQQYSGKTVPMASVDGGPLGHFVFMAGTDLRTYLANGSRGSGPPVPGYCISVKGDKALRVQGAIATLYQCSDSSDSPDDLELVLGHDLLVWNDSGMTCEVSFHGHSQVNVDLDTAVADATQLVEPSNS